MSVVESMTITVYVGLRERYSEHVHPRSVITDAVAAYCDLVGLCVSVTDTEFIYTNGREPGVVIGLINYPRFPTTWNDLLEHALEIGRRAGDAAEQHRVSIVAGPTTHMLTLRGPE